MQARLRSRRAGAGDADRAGVSGGAVGGLGCGIGDQRSPVVRASAGASTSRGEVLVPNGRIYGGRSWATGTILTEGVDRRSARSRTMVATRAEEAVGKVHGNRSGCPRGRPGIPHRPLADVGQADRGSAAQPTDDLGQPTDERGNLLLHDPRDLFDGRSCGWVIVVGPLGSGVPCRQLPRGSVLSVRPAGSTVESASVDFVSELPGAYDTDFLLYEGRGAVPAWGRDLEESVTSGGPAVTSDVLEHIDAVAAAVREIKLTEPSPIEAIFLDGLLDQLEVLREHVNSDEPTPRRARSYAIWCSSGTSCATCRYPRSRTTWNMIAQALNEILRIAGS